MKVAALIVAAGRGHRAGSDIPKQYIELCGKSILYKTISAFTRSPYVDFIQTVIHKDDRNLYKAAIDDITILEPVFGGDTRQQSVMNGLQSLAIHEPDIVLIHDAARPFISPNHIEDIIVETTQHGAVVPTLPLVDTIKQIKNQSIEQTVDRSILARAQTPQAFRFKLIFMAHRKMEDKGLTDDSAIAEACGIKVKTIPGDENNFKITTKSDLKKAQQMIMENKTDIRTGLGYDVHAFEQGNNVTLGGITIPHDKSLKGHSDADVALHALTDALLGTIGAGDIGTHFPPSEQKWKGANSDIFLKHAVKLINDQEGIISNIDLTIICEAPKILPHREAMQEKIADIVNITPQRVSIKATTTEKLGFTGREEGIAAQAIATVRLPERYDE